MSDRRKVRAQTRLSQLQKRLLGWLYRDYQRTQGRTSSSHYELVRAVAGDKGNLSHSLRLLEQRGLLGIGRSPGGKAEYVFLTAAGHHQAAQLTGEGSTKGKRRLTSHSAVA
jgi:DNA-binding MarR family transcriptional regulator